MPVPRPFRFGSAALHELCTQVQATEVSVDKENPYFDRFAIPD